MEAARSMILTSRLEKKYWSEAINTAVYLLNRTTNRRLNGITPYELWTGQKPDLSHIRILGTEAWKKTEHFQRKKLDGKSEKRILVGYEPNKSYRLLDPETGKIEYSCSVIFNEKEVISKDYIFWEDDSNETQNQEVSLLKQTSKYKRELQKTMKKPISRKKKKNKSLQLEREKPTGLQENDERSYHLP
jgi:hypothetical protein